PCSSVQAHRARTRCHPGARAVLARTVLPRRRNRPRSILDGETARTRTRFARSRSQSEQWPAVTHRIPHASTRRPETGLLRIAARRAAANCPGAVPQPLGTRWSQRGGEFPRWWTDDRTIG